MKKDELKKKLSELWNTAERMYRGYVYLNIGGEIWFAPSPVYSPNIIAGLSCPLGDGPGKQEWIETVMQDTQRKGER